MKLGLGFTFSLRITQLFNINIIVFLYLLDFSKCGINVDPRRIAQSTVVGLWPWMGSLGTYERGNWTHKCGASLIDDTRVITAAHCVLSEKKVLAR